MIDDDELADVLRPRRVADGGTDGGAGGNPGQQAFLARQAARHIERVVVVDCDHVVDQGGIDHFGNEAGTEPWI